MLRTFLWASECQIADEVRGTWKRHLAVLEREVEEADRRRASTARLQWGADRRDKVAQECHQVASALLDQLEDELQEAREAHAECGDVLFKMTARLGRPSGLQVPACDAAGTPLLETLSPLREQLNAATARLEALILRDREKLHDLAVQEDSRLQSSDSHSSVALEDIDSMSPSQFVDLVERLLQRDGFQTARPDELGSATFVSAACPKGHTLLFSAHRVDGPRGWQPEPPANVGAPTLHAMRLAAGRHERDLVVITNGGFSGPARRYAAEHGMNQWSRRVLQRWAEWEETLECGASHEQDAA
ncbi:restriction endonuclease [Streptomyces sp. NPDC052114]|uniref:restriction endonuclease n=1 Tax=unclassified Streptomyces TaxID=2593676 RepID=UPI0034329E07